MTASAPVASPSPTPALPSGLTAAEVAASRRQHGPNLLARPEPTPWWKLFAEKLRDPIIRILIAAALLTAVTGGWVEGCGIALAVLLATGLAFLNEYRAGREFEVLNQVDDTIPTKTIRDGDFVMVPRRDLVVGDLIFVETGEEIPADAEVVQAVNCHLDQSKFTGEPEPVVKLPVDSPAAAALGEATYPHHLLLRGSTVLDGYAYARITAVGGATEMGRTALAAAVDVRQETPLQRQLTRLSRLIAVVGSGIAALLFTTLVVMALRHGALPAAPAGWLTMETLHLILGFFMIALTLIVVAVPEGLAMSVTLSLAYSMRRMTRENNLVRKMHACETIGAATVICTDKTGTLTMNRMEVKSLHFPMFGDAVGELPADPPGAALVAEAMAADSTANLGREDGGVLGNPTEGALLLLRRCRIDYRAVRRDFAIRRQWTFTTERKFMGTLGDSADGTAFRLHVKGAPEIILDRCRRVAAAGGEESLTPEWRQRIRDAFAAAQASGCRTLAFACRDSVPETDDLETAADDLVYLGFVAIADPVRPDVPDAVAACRRAGIDIKVVTGDTPGTAAEIGRQIGLFAGKPTGEELISGREFGALSVPEAEARVVRLRIISRARPEDKLKLVRALQHNGEVVAVTGDGTNDAPALNHADVGIAMGQTGTAIAREAADIILLDDSFHSIVNAVLWGRSLYANIQRFILFQLTINVAAVGIAVIGPFLGIEMPLTVIQMLWVNLIMDTLAALALATEPPDPEVMNRPPRRTAAFIVTPAMAWNIFLTAAFFLVLFIAMLTGWKRVGDEELSVFFTVFVMLQFWNLFNAKCFGSNRSIFTRLFDNRIFLLIALGIAAGQWLIVEFGGRFFRTVPLSAGQYAAIVGGTSIILWAGELVRCIHRLTARRRQ